MTNKQMDKNELVNILDGMHGNISTVRENRSSCRSKMTRSTFRRSVPT